MPKSSQNDLPTDGKYAPKTTGATGPRGAAALDQVEAELVRTAIVAVLTAGDAILLGTTRDGGAVAMQLYSGDNIDKLYGSGTGELSTLLQGLVEAAQV